jgi:CheY-like chemotaxis protein
MNNRVLVCVDDDPSILLMLQYQLEILLEGKNCMSEFYEDSNNAIREIESMIHNGLDIAAIVVDYQMPNINGNMFVRTLKSKFPDLKFIMLSGQANDVQIDELLSEKLLDAFISKPWTVEELTQKLEKYIQ